MPRRARVHVEGGVYHVILRGNHREPLFGADRDRAYLNALVGDVVARFGLQVLAYCWMTNHLHLAIRTGATPLAKPMQRLAMRYALHVHRDAGQTGHLFERRYRAILVDADSYLLALVRYIHLNPVVAGMTADPAGYRWSSHRDYLGIRTVDWVDTRLVLGMFSGGAESGPEQYARFMGNWTEDDLAPFVPHESRETRGMEPAEPARIPVAPKPSAQLAELAVRHCQRAGITLVDLSSTSRARSLSAVRRTVAAEALATGLATLAEVGRLLGRSPSAVVQLVSRRHPDDT